MKIKDGFFLLQICLAFILCAPKAMAQSMSPHKNIRTKNLEREEEDMEIVEIDQEIRPEGRFRWRSWTWHGILGLGYAYTNNINEGFLEDSLTGAPFHKQQRDHMFNVNPGTSLTFRQRFFQLSGGYRGDYTWYGHYDEYNSYQHTGFFLGKYLQEYWRFYTDVFFRKFSQQGKKEHGQTTDVFDTEHVKIRGAMQIDLPPFWVFRENILELQIQRYDDVAQGLDTHYTDYQIGWSTALSETLSASIMMGFQYRRYGVRSDNARQFPDFTGFVGSLKVGWQISEKGALSLEVIGDLDDDQFGDSGYKYVETYTLKYIRKLSPFWEIALGPTISVERFSQTNQDPNYPLRKRVDLRYMGTIEITYNFATWGRINFTYTYLFIDSNMEIFDTEVHTLAMLIEFGF